MLSERYVRLAINELKRDIEGLAGFISVGNELERHAEYCAWLADLEAYYKQHHGDIVANEAAAHEEFLATFAAKLAERGGLQL